MAYRVVICGSNYGRAYFQALAASAGRYRPAALLARGSERSQRLARRYGVPLCRTVGEVPGEVDFACVALPSSVSDVVPQLLRRGIHALAEHPQRPAALEAAYRQAAASGSRLHVNGHFRDLPAPRAFVERWRRDGSTLGFLDVMVQERALYAVLDILHQVVDLRRLVLGRVSAAAGFVTLEGELGGVRALFQIQVPPERPADGSSSYLVDLRVVAGCGQGILSLLSTAGPVVWNANVNRGSRRAEPLWKIVHGPEGPTGDELLWARGAANLAALDRLAREVETGQPAPEARSEHALAVARAWQNIGARLRSVE